MYVETFDGSFKEQTTDIDSNHCCGRGYPAHCLRTYGADKNTSAHHKRHGETSEPKLMRDIMQLVRCH